MNKERVFHFVPTSTIFLLLKKVVAWKLLLMSELVVSMEALENVGSAQKRPGFKSKPLL
jgi:hypothetical protein